ncbi:MAG: LLM class flavin-dependent oxidoreductase, partial [Pseudomonadota bacterium]
MKMGIMQGADRTPATIEDISAMAVRAEAAGFDSLWMAHIRALDAISALTVAGTATQRIELGTAVTPIYPRHPMALVQQALTAAQACAGRFTLGIGLSHKVVVEGMLGLSYDKPARYMRDYLGAMLPLLHGEVTNYQGELFTINGLQIDMPGVAPPSVIIAALGPVMLKMTGRL